MKVVMSFGDNEEEGVLYLHDNVMVVTMLVANFTTRRILIDNGNSANIFFGMLSLRWRLIPIACN